MGEEEAWIDHPIPSAVMYQNIMRQLRRQKIRRFIAYAAAVFIPIALIIGLFIRINSQVDLLADGGYDEVYVPNGERMQLLFQDGSKVHLNSGSRIRYPKNSVSPNVRFIWKERLGSRSPRTRIGLLSWIFLIWI